MTDETIWYGAWHDHLRVSENIKPVFLEPTDEDGRPICPYLWRLEPSPPDCPCKACASGYAQGVVGGAPEPTNFTIGRSSSDKTGGGQ